MYLHNPRRPARAHEWAAGKIFTFIVTLAAEGSVTLAAEKAGMSRKSAYALKARDPAFAGAWKKAAGAKARQGVLTVPEGDSRTRAAMSNLSTANHHARTAAEERDHFFASLAAKNRQNAPAGDSKHPNRRPIPNFLSGG